MDYDNFKKEWNAFNEWNTDDKCWEFLDEDTQKNTKQWNYNNLVMFDQASLKDGKHWLRMVEKYHDEIPPVNNDGEIVHPYEQKDMVNSPAHYTRGTQEAIDIIEEAIQDAPDVKAGMLQAQALKYLLRLWLKGNAPQDSKKAQWYLNRLIEHLSATLKE